MPKKVMTSPLVTEDLVETLTDNDFVHVHTHSESFVGRPGYWYGTLLVADDPTSLIAGPRGMINIGTSYLTRAAVTFDGYVCFDCRRRLRMQLIGE